VETIRHFTRAQQPSHLQAKAKLVATYDAYFQVLALFEKVSRLSLEYTHSQSDLPVLKNGVRRPKDVVLTWSDEDSDIRAAYAGGVNSFVSKPVNIVEFTEAVKELGLYWMIVNKTVY
jgi:hypothetical protein